MTYDSTLGDHFEDDRALAEDGEPGRVHTIGGDRRIHGRGDVGGGKSEVTAPLLTVHDDPLDPVRPTERLGGAFHITGGNT